MDRHYRYLFSETKEHFQYIIFTSCRPASVKIDLPKEKYFRFQKALDGQRLATQF